MREIVHANTSRVYFVSANTKDRRPMFLREAVVRIFLQNLFHYRRERHFLIHSFTVMPEHFHVIVSPLAPVSLEKTMQFIRGGFSFRYRKAGGTITEIWQKGYTHHRVRDEEDYVNHCLYIEQNAVKRGLVSLAEEYKYCSAYPGYRLDPAPDLTG